MLREKIQNRAQRVRRNLKKTAGDRPRLSVFRSHKNICAQIIDDKTGRTLAHASSLDKDLKLAKGSDCQAANAVGDAIAGRAKKAGVDAVVFDRGAYLYHGRVKALAEAARAGGLNF